MLRLVDIAPNPWDYVKIIPSGETGVRGEKQLSPREVRQRVRTAVFHVRPLVPGFSSRKDKARMLRADRKHPPPWGEISRKVWEDETSNFLGKFIETKKGTDGYKEISAKRRLTGQQILMLMSCRAQVLHTLYGKITFEDTVAILQAVFVFQAHEFMALTHGPNIIQLLTAWLNHTKGLFGNVLDPVTGEIKRLLYVIARDIPIYL